MAHAATVCTPMQSPTPVSEIRAPPQPATLEVTQLSGISSRMQSLPQRWSLHYETKFVHSHELLSDSTQFATAGHSLPMVG
jgi:hypothetical protein